MLARIPGVCTSPQLYQLHGILGPLSHQPTDGHSGLSETHNTSACTYTPMWKDKIPQSVYVHA